MWRHSRGNSPSRTWKLTSIKILSTVKHGRVVAKGWSTTHTCIYSVTALGIFDVTAMDISCPLPPTKKGITLVVEITDLFLNLAGAVVTSQATATHKTTFFLDHWIVQYVVPHFLFTKNGSQFMSCFFAPVCGCHSVRHMTSTWYLLQIKKLVESFNITEIGRFWHYVVKRQNKWNELF